MRRFLKVIGAERKEKGCYISICQFNILASNLASGKHFPYVRPEVLAWEKRREILLNEIKGLMSSVLPEAGWPDILCCQELSNYWTFFKPELAKRGYDSVYLGRPSLHFSEWSGDQKKDGCGVFFQTSRFDLVNERSVFFHDVHDRVALIIVLREKSLGRLIIIANTHLYWNAMKLEDQMKELKEVDDAIVEVMNETAEEFKIKSYLIPIFVCGDLNNGPTSDIYRYMSESFLRKKGLVMRSAYDTYSHLVEHHNTKTQATPPTPIRVLSSPFFASEPSSSETSASTSSVSSDPPKGQPTYDTLNSTTLSVLTSSNKTPREPSVSPRGITIAKTSPRAGSSHSVLSHSNSSTVSGSSSSSSSSASSSEDASSSSSSSSSSVSKSSRNSLSTVLSPNRRLSIPDDRSIPPPFQPIPVPASTPSLTTPLPALFRSVTAPPGALLNPSFTNSYPTLYELSSPDPDGSKHLAFNYSTPPRLSKINMRNGEKAFKVKTDIPYGSEYEPSLTTLNYKRAWTIDYIWHSSYVTKKGGSERDESAGKLHPQLRGILEIPSEGDLRSEDGPPGWVEKEKQHGEPLLDPAKNNNGIPNSLFGSDHVPLVAVFSLPALPTDRADSPDKERDKSGS